ncbi:hypothetical protein RND71_013358 [Anisodus tanguticus]|uniref:Glabrous enhancer-binding protein-like DBD domain-containing protein n=1 Tax=Anisodus tanguticus TaxID=243964 RepID=A0AAE1VMK7_9SOLA|nr:hypothetical protein RND71_013358 [Anisodus tanguticus]
MTHPRPRKEPTSAVNHRTNSPKSSSKSTTPITKTISKSPETHRVFTENDEIQLLKFLSQSPNNNTVTFNGNFTETQIAKKLKRLKEKYHKFARSKSLIKTPHDQKIYEFGRKIWGRNAAKGKEPVIELHEKRNEYCLEGLRRLGKEKLKKMNEKWMELKLEESELTMNKGQGQGQKFEKKIGSGSGKQRKKATQPKLWTGHGIIIEICHVRIIASHNCQDEK